MKCGGQRIVCEYSSFLKAYTLKCDRCGLFTYEKAERSMWGWVIGKRHVLRCNRDLTQTASHPHP